MKNNNQNFKDFLSLSENFNKEKIKTPPLSRGFIYLITNSINNKVYIGQTCVNVKKRWSAHKTEAKNTNEKKQNSVLYRAMRKIGIEYFQCNEIFSVFKKEDLDWAEQILIKQWDCRATDNDKGYNTLRGGEQKINLEKYACPHCNAQGIGNSLIKYHFDSCKMLPKNCQNERFYEITFNDGKKEIVNNIGAFCKHHHISDQRLRNGKHKDFSMTILEGIDPQQLSEVKIYNAHDYVEQRQKVKPDTSKEWIIEFPDGHQEIHNGLIDFAKKHDLTHTSLRKVADGTRSHHKGFKCFRK